MWSTEIIKGPNSLIFLWGCSKEKFTSNSWIPDTVIPAHWIPTRTRKLFAFTIMSGDSWWIYTGAKKRGRQDSSCRNLWRTTQPRDRRCRQPWSPSCNLGPFTSRSASESWSYANACNAAKLHTTADHSRSHSLRKQLPYEPQALLSKQESQLWQ